MTETTRTATSREVVEAFFDHLARGATADIAELYDPDTSVVQPFAPGGPYRLDGREALRNHFSRAGGVPIKIGLRNLVLYETTDPEVIVAEYDYETEVTTTGATVTTANIQVFQVRGGLIRATRDFHDHAGMARLMADGSS